MFRIHLFVGYVKELNGYNRKQFSCEILIIQNFVYLYFITEYFIMDGFKKRFTNWPSTILGIITVLFALFEIYEIIPATMLIIMIGRTLAFITGIVLIFSKL